MPRIRAPYEFNDVPINNNYRPVQIDEGAMTATARTAQGAFQTVQDIVNAAADAAHRNNAAADATQLEAELDRIRREVDSEPIPDGYDPEKWINGMPGRFQQRAEQARQNIARARGISATTRYSEYFTPQAQQILARETGAMSERAQARMVDWGRGAVVENAAIARARAMDPDVAPDVREAQAVKARQIYEDAVRDGLLTRSEAESSIAQFDEQYVSFNRNAGRAAQALQRAREIQSQTQDPTEQLRLAREIPDLALGQAVADNILQDLQRTQQARAAQIQDDERIARAEIERNPANWMSRVDPVIIARLGANDRMDGLRATTRSILAYGVDGSQDLPGSPGSAARVAIRGPQIARGLTAMARRGNSADVEFVATIGLDDPLTQREADILNGNMDTDIFAAGSRLSTMMRAEDIRAVLNLRDALNNGGTFTDPASDGPFTLEEQAMDTIHGVARGLGAYPTGNSNQDRRARDQFDQWARRALHAMWGDQPLPVSTDDARRIVATAMRRAGGSSMQYSSDVSPGVAAQDPEFMNVPPAMITAAVRNIIERREDQWRTAGNPNARSLREMSSEQQRMVQQELGRMFNDFNNRGW